MQYFTEKYVFLRTAKEVGVFSPEKRKHGMNAKLSNDI